MNVDSSNTISKYIPYLEESYDVILRLRPSSENEGKIKVDSVPTSDFKRFFDIFLHRFKEDRDVFIKTIKWQKYLLDYTSHYTSFLLGSINEKEFLKISKEYIVEHKNCTDIESLSKDIFVLINSTKISFLTQELSNIFQYKEEKVLEAMKLIAKEEKDL
jgi:hypothetical protein